MKSEWGQKRTCQACAARFYDMKKNPAVCPKCGKEFDPALAVKKRRGRPPLAEKRKAEAEAAAAAKVKASAEETVVAETLEVEVEVDAEIEIEDSDDALLVTDDDDLQDEGVVQDIAPAKEE